MAIRTNGGDPVINWAWAVIAFFAGAVFGICLFAFLEVSREMDKESERRSGHGL